MNLATRSYQQELLDQENIPFDDIKQNLKELNFINTWLGGHAITLKGIQKLLSIANGVTICEIGCGGGDNLAAINSWCKQKKIDARFIGIDLKAECIAYAQRNIELSKVTTWMICDYREAFVEKPDIIFSSLFCHHFTNQQLHSQLLWMQENSRLGFFINDLERSPIAYNLIKWLTSIFSASYLVKNDAPLSVARGFKKRDWLELLTGAEIANYEVEWKWAFRHLVTCKK